ncbi:MAG: hypothetical protein AAGF59_06585 [Pseudomonadota bacterium]
MTVRKTLFVAGLAVLMAGTALAQELRPEGLAPLGPPPIPADNPMSDAKVELGPYAE